MVLLTKTNIKQLKSIFVNWKLKIDIGLMLMY